MAYYSENLIDDVLSSLDIVQVINEYVPLKRRGVNYIGLCPFHKEKTPSFTVSPDKQIYKCFGCSEGGTMIQFISKMENLEFGETLEFLADKARLDTKKYEIHTGKNVVTENREQKDIIFEINKESAMYFYEALEEEVKKENSILKDYLIKRKLDMNVIRRFGIGYGTKKGESLHQRLANKGYSIKDITAAGVITNNRSGNYYEPFGFRLIFPIFDTRDRVIGFGGRVLDNSLPKYVNSPENVVYHKGRNLYGLNIAKKEKLDNLLIVEGYMDALSLQKSGINFAVASLGTALTENQARLIKKYTDTVILGYDQDGAGQAAILRAIDILRKENLKVKVLKLDKQDAKDPDEYIIKYGKDKLLECIKQSITAVEFKISKYYENIDLSVFEQKVTFLTNVASAIAEVENSIEREMYIDKISKDYKISKDAIVSEVDKKLNKVASSDTKLNKFKEEDYKRKLEGSTILRKRQEQYIISLLLTKERKIIDKVFNIFKLEDFQFENIKTIYGDLIQLDKVSDITKINVVTKLDSNEKISIITEIMCIDISKLDKEKLILDLENQFKKSRYMKRREEILNKMKDLNITKEEREMLEIELSQLILKLKK